MGNYNQFNNLIGSDRIQSDPITAKQSYESWSKLFAPRIGQISVFLPETRKSCYVVILFYF